MFPERSVTNIRPSGANARSQGNFNPDCTTVVVSLGALPAAGGRPGTGIVRKTPRSSLHHAPSTTGRRGSGDVPAARGARTRNVNVGGAPGAAGASGLCPPRGAEGPVSGGGGP